MEEILKARVKVIVVAGTHKAKFSSKKKDQQIVKFSDNTEIRFKKLTSGYKIRCEGYRTQEINAQDIVDRDYLITLVKK